MTYTEFYSVLVEIRNLLVDIRNMTAVALEQAVAEADQEEADRLNRRTES